MQGNSQPLKGLCWSLANLALQSHTVTAKQAKPQMNKKEASLQKNVRSET